jgi:hypothetical protein
MNSYYVIAKRFFQLKFVRKHSHAVHDVSRKYIAVVIRLGAVLTGSRDYFSCFLALKQFPYGLTCWTYG